MSQNCSICNKPVDDSIFHITDDNDGSVSHYPCFYAKNHTERELAQTEEDVRKGYMRIVNEGYVELPQGATHIYTAVLHPDVQRRINIVNHCENVFIRKERVYVPMRNSKYISLLLVTY